MQDFILTHYLVFKSFHIIAFTAWMAGMFYLPRLFVYHTQVKSGSEASEKFKVMEVKLLRVIINPAMMVTWILGGLMLYAMPDYLSQPWFHVKFLLVFILSGFHGFLSRWRKGFLRDQNTHSERFYRLMNEVPTLLFIGIVFMVILKPF